MPDTIFKGDHPRTIVAKFGSKWPNGFRGEDLQHVFPIGSCVKVGPWQPSWMMDEHVRYNFQSCNIGGK
jgi:hypothetical protein